MSNGRLTHLLAFESYEAPMMVAALRLARNTAMMCGGHGRKRLEAMLDEVKALVPVISRHFDEEKFADMGRALQDAKTFSVTWARNRHAFSWDAEGYMVVMLDGVIALVSSRSEHRKDSPLMMELKAYLSEIAPLTADYVEFEEVPL